MAAPRSAAILGGGITGLVAAHRLRALGWDVTLHEASERTGGALRTLRDGPWLAEAGPNSLLDNSEPTRALLRELGLSERIQRAGTAAKNRYIVRGGKLRALPAGPISFLTTALFSPKAKLRLLAEPFIKPAPPEARESLAQFALRRLGQEFLDYAVDPFVTGVYAGDPSYLSVKAAFAKLHALEQTHGSLIRGAFAKRNASAGPKGGIFSFPEGLEEITRALSAPLSDRINLRSRITGARRAPGGRWELLRAEGGATPGTYDAVLVAVPAGPLSEFRIDTLDTEHMPFTRLAHVPHPPVVSVFLGFRREAVRHRLNGFGLLVPSKERRRILGVLFSSTLFPGRAPPGHVALTVMVGGVRSPEQAALEDQSLLAMVRTELTALLGIQGLPTYSRITRWPRAIPQYGDTILHARETAQTAETAHPGLFFGGQALDGVAVPACIEAGEKLAARASAAR